MKFFRRFGRAFVHLIRKQLVELSGYMAYAALLSLFPFLILLVSLAGLLVSFDAESFFMTHLKGAIPKEMANVLLPLAQDVVYAHHGKIFTVSFVGLLWTTSSGVEALRTGLNKAYDLVETRSTWWCRLHSLGIILLTILGATVTVLSVVVAPVLFQFLTPYFPFIAEWKTGLVWGQYGASFMTLVLVFSLFYKVLPNHTVRWFESLFGAVLAAVLWLIMGSGFSIYLKSFSEYSVVYGGLASAVITLLFFHLTALTILFGAQFNDLRSKNAEPL